MKKLAENDLTYFYLRHVVIVVLGGASQWGIYDMEGLTMDHSV
jgi:hypothetical protein